MRVYLLQQKQKRENVRQYEYRPSMRYFEERAWACTRGRKWDWCAKGSSEKETKHFMCIKWMRNSFSSEFHNSLSWARCRLFLFSHLIKTCASVCRSGLLLLSFTLWTLWTLPPHPSPSLVALLSAMIAFGNDEIVRDRAHVKYHRFSVIWKREKFLTKATQTHTHLCWWHQKLVGDYF